MYGSTTNTKLILGQTTDVNNDKIERYRTLAFNWINAAVTNIEAVIPIPLPDAYVSDFEDKLAAAYFWKYESGDNTVAPELEKTFLTVYMRQKYNRPRFITRVGF
jgi:hypothetical protein